MKYLILITIYLTLQSCNSDDPNINNNDNGQALSANIDVLNSQLTIYYNEITLDGSNSTGNIDNYKWEIIDAPASYNYFRPSENQNTESYLYHNDQLPEVPLLSFKAREVGNYTIKLTVNSGNEQSSTEISFFVSNEEPNYTFSNIHDELFNNSNEWNISNYSIEEDIATLPAGTAHGYDTLESIGGNLSFNNNIEVDTGTYLYWKAKKNLPNLNTEPSNFLFTIKSTSDEFGYQLSYTDAWDFVSDIKIVFDGYLISFKGDLNNQKPLLFCCFVDDEFYRTNLSNQDIRIYFYRNVNGEYSINAICNNQNISERIQISETDLQDSIEFYFYSTRKHNGGGLKITPKNLNIVKYNISEF
ncbi:hypothetical protein [Lacinutrix sp.]|uniref:hypothetical protein n=1 Tax=Lacinutrix sp. TaxID=1937692 RepID=UPI0025B8D4C5|nr:hypothetical protein [Lacinutrix sp.]